MKKTLELKPCPFCGGKAYIHTEKVCYGHGDYGEEVSVTCQKCYAQGPTYDNYQATTSLGELRIKAADAWNQREIEKEEENGNQG